MASSQPSIDLLLNLVPDSPQSVLRTLGAHASLASASDGHGYSLVHAAASYGHLTLLRALIQTYNVSPNVTDEDNETPLFAVENVEVARCLVEELHADVKCRNADGLTAEEKMESEGENPLVCAYLREVTRRHTSSETNGSSAHTAPTSSADASASKSHQDDDLHAHRVPPPLPQGVQINVGTMEEAPPGEDDASGPDPAFRRRIEELAARDDFQGEDGQRQLRELVTDAVAGLASEQQTRDVRRRNE